MRTIKVNTDDIQEHQVARYAFRRFLHIQAVVVGGALFLVTALIIGLLLLYGALLDSRAEIANLRHRMSGVEENTRINYGLAIAQPMSAEAVDLLRDTLRDTFTTVTYTRNLDNVTHSAVTLALTRTTRLMQQDVLHTQAISTTQRRLDDLEQRLLSNNQIWATQALSITQLSRALEHFRWDKAVAATLEELAVQDTSMIASALGDDLTPIECADNGRWPAASSNLFGDKEWCWDFVALAPVDYASGDPEAGYYLTFDTFDKPGFGAGWFTVEYWSADFVASMTYKLPAWRLTSAQVALLHWLPFIRRE